jgi:oxygen-dependent protoporphyrinogen oxidase
MNGMQHLAETLVSRLTSTSLVTNATVKTVVPESGRWRVFADERSELFDKLIVALPGLAAAQVLRDTSAELASELAGIQYSSSITVGIAYGNEVRRALPPGFGFLVPRSEGKKLLAATFVHNKFPHRAPADIALLRCFFAGNVAEEVWTLSDEQLIGIVRNELQQIVGLRAEPRFARVYRWKWAISSGFRESMFCGSRFPDWPWQAMDLEELEFPIAFVLDAMQQSCCLPKLEPTSPSPVLASSAPGLAEFPRIQSRVAVRL